jgi:hypothetical protein
MKLAYVHILPIEYYPPATNALTIFSGRKSWQVRAWTTRNARGAAAWTHNGIEIRRPFHAAPDRPFLQRMAGYTNWHLRTALELARWKPDAILAVEPHSMLAVWLYFELLGGSAKLFVHHHEYYAPEDYTRPGMRLLAVSRRIERDSLWRRTVWVSETNDQRLKLLLKDNPSIRQDAARVLPNYPPQEWIERASDAGSSRTDARTRLIYLGSASLEDTFIREVAEWVASRPSDFSLHVTGNNVAASVWAFIRKLAAPNITIDTDGAAYERLPEVLSQFDVGLILYKGNTLNFVYNVPNKAIEYLACGLEVWYPREMTGMREFREDHGEFRIEEIDFTRLGEIAPRPVRRETVNAFPFTAEGALARLITELDRISDGVK